MSPALTRRQWLNASVGGSLIPILTGCLTTEDQDGDSADNGSSADDGGTQEGDSNDSGETQNDEEASEDSADDDESEVTEDTDGTERRSQTEEADYDVVVEYESHVQWTPSGEYELPEPRSEEWGWLVVDFEVVEGELDTEDVWFNGLFETDERYYTVAHATSDLERGIESRGAIREGGSGIVLHRYPPGGAEPVGWNLSATDQSVGGEVLNDGPQSLYPSTTVAYSVETSENPAVLDDDDAELRSDSDLWAVVTLEVTDGVLNMEDVWFRSQLYTETRVYDLDHTSSKAERGIQSRGLVKQGNRAYALYKIGGDENIDEWGYDDPRQDVTVIER